MEIANTVYNAAIYVNKRRKILEAHLLNVAIDVYGENAIIQLLEKVREDQVFMDPHALAEQIQKDLAAINEYFKTH